MKGCNKGICAPSPQLQYSGGKEQDKKMYIWIWVMFCHCCKNTQNSPQSALQFCFVIRELFLMHNFSIIELALLFIKCW